MIGKEKKSKKRGSRGGVRERLKKRSSREPLTTITLSNVRALQNKIDELTALVRFDGNFRCSNLMCFTEAWLTDDIDNILVPGFTAVRADRDNDKAQKSVVCGLCMFVSDTWARQYCVRERECTRDVELLTVSFRPFCLPREFDQITVILVDHVFA